VTGGMWQPDGAGGRHGSGVGALAPIQHVSERGGASLVCGALGMRGLHHARGLRGHRWHGAKALERAPAVAFEGFTLLPRTKPKLIPYVISSALSWIALQAVL
jgi:hypothetical protein